MTQRRTKILVIDDDMRLRELLRRYLSEQGFAVDAAADAAQMDKALTRENYHLMVLDLMLPGEDGLAICRRLRGAGNTTPIVMLTAKGDEIDRIVGLEMGADDYLPKPFNPRELLARINAVLRRRPPQEAPGAPSGDNEVATFGPFTFDLGTRALQKVLVSHPRQPLSRDKLMDLARGREHEAFDRTIDIQISRLRKLIEEDNAKPRYIQTVWGFGYVFVPDGGAQ